MIVADSGPIIAFARIGRLDLLHAAMGEPVLIPRAVYAELTAHAKRRPNDEELRDLLGKGWLEVRPITQSGTLQDMPRALHEGEQEAIALALEVHARLLMDDSLGRREARRRGLTVLGALRVVLNAKRMGLIGKAGPVFQGMADAGYWMDDKLKHQALEEAGEA